MDEILAYTDESFNLYMLYAPQRTGPKAVLWPLVLWPFNVVSLDILFKPGSTLLNLGNVLQK